MSQYLLSTYRDAGQALDASPTPEEMQGFMLRVAAVEEEMEQNGAFVFGGGLHGPDAATVVSIEESEIVMTDGPFAESKEHIAGFYIINADDLDGALSWAGKVAAAIGHSIEVRPVQATGRGKA